MEKRNPKFIRLIQYMIKDLGLTEPEYRAVYEKVTRKSQVRLMDNNDLERIVMYLKSLNKQMPVKKYKGVAMCAEPSAKKARSLWLKLRDCGVLRDASEAALLSYVQRLTGSNSMDNLTPQQFFTLIESLKNWLDRVSTPPVPQETA